MGCGSSLVVPSDALSNRSERGLKAALLIQRWYRRRLTWMEAKRQCHWAIFQKIEYAGEQDQHKLHQFFTTCLEVFPQAEPGFAVSSMHSEVYKKIEIETDYAGPHLQFPLTLKSLRSLLDGFKSSKVLHARYAVELLYHAKAVLKTQANIRLASTKQSREITICGDIHGKFDDLLVMLHKNNLPSSENPFVFNGDFVDRGQFSVEVALVLFTLLLLYPSDVYLNRGNHEDYLMNMRYGFTKEIEVKYKVGAWKSLDYRCLIDGKVLVVHGGVSQETDIKYLQQVKRSKYVSVLKPVGIDRTDVDQMQEWQQVVDLLWSDPQASDGCKRNHHRGSGKHFGPDVSQSVLSHNGIELLVRSHQCKPDGYEYTHKGKVLTVFSASSYFGPGSNLGAYVKISSDMKVHCVQFQARKTGQDVSIRERMSAVEDAAIRELKDLLIASKHALLAKYRQNDFNDTGLLSVNLWAALTAEVTQLNVPWRTLHRRLVKVNSSGLVEYLTLMDDTQVVFNYDKSQPVVTEALYRKRSDLEMIFRCIDKDHSGYLTIDEFEEACTVLSQHTDVDFPPNYACDLANSMDLDKDGRICFNEFLECFRIVDNEERRISFQRQETAL